jgi:regulatory protein
VKITDIKQQLKQADRYSFYVDGKYAFSLSETALLEQRLVSGQELTNDQLVAYKRLSTDDKLYNNALRYAVMRPHSHWELSNYLKRKQAEEPVAKQILEKLERLGLVDDVAFGRSWVANRHLLKAVSKRRLTQELKQKRVPDDVISQVLDEDESDERTILRNLVAKKRQQSQYQDKNKLLQYLASQGFSYDDIKYVLQDTQD